jgi:tRNA-uridine 2-sulfurtransferase
MKFKAKQKILVGLSGGVDSAVSAYLLKQQGYEVYAVFMKNFSMPSRTIDCPWKEDLKEAKKVAKHLDIPLETWNFEREYHERVLDQMVMEYQRGRTPNPDVMCNTFVKFGVFLERAKKEGFDLIATGHYAGVKKSRDGTYHLLKAKDTNKDQSYFLAGLGQPQLRHVVFPLADITKPEVRTIAARIKLPNADRKDSQGVCFIGKIEMSDFLKTWIRPKRGDIVDTKGNKLGSHNGVYYYTIGQRKGIRIGGGPSLYVIDKDIKRNRLIVGTEGQLELFKKEIIVSEWHWLGRPLALPLRCNAKIRYRQDDQSVVISKFSGKKVRVRFARPQKAVSPGQTFAAYKGRELVGSGIIK